MKCGGSDGLSGITANPALGVASDLLVAQGATTVLSETPEIYGAEHLLTRRAISPEVAQKLIDRITWWKEYAAWGGGDLDNNPSVGNKAGGITTILEKSLGAVAKAGTSPLNAVYHFAEAITATHPMGEKRFGKQRFSPQALVTSVEAAVVEQSLQIQEHCIKTAGGRFQVRWNENGTASALGQLAFLLNFLKRVVFLNAVCKAARCFTPAPTPRRFKTFWARGYSRSWMDNGITPTSAACRVIRSVRRYWG